MDLSNDLISKFVKITNDGNKKKTKEGTVYGTIIKYDGSMYVKIDGSDLLTPIDTTADIKEGERVTIMIKDHNATVTGNITSPSASSADVKKVTRNVEEIEGEITEFEAIIADVVHVGELDAEVARIDELIAGKATIEDLTATNAEITNLKAKDAEIENLVADKATIEDLTATNAEITNLKAKDAKIENLVADKATIEDLTATNAEITNLKANKADITYLDANFATIDELEATHANIDVLDAEVANINTLVNGNLTSDNILSFNITSKNTTMEDAFIKDAMIDRITANKIMSGTIDTNNVVIQSTDGSMLLQGNIIQMKDESGKVRIQIGKDNGGNFTFVLYDETGKGVLIDEEGIKSSDAIADGLIVDAKVADNANISGSKLDIASVITEVNNDNSTTIKSSKIYLNEQNQSLEVAFNSLKTQVETIKDVTIDGDLSNIVEQVQSNTTKIEANKEGINTLVAENVIRTEEISDLEGELQQVNTTLSNKYASLEQNLDGFKTTVSDTYTTKAEFDNLEVGGRNLLLSSKIEATNNGYGIMSRRPTELFEVGETYTVSICVTPAKGVSFITPYVSGGYVIIGGHMYVNGTAKQVISTTFTFKGYASGRVPTDTSDDNAMVTFYRYPNDGTVTSNTTIHWAKVEKGAKATDWTPAPEDVQANIDAVDGKFVNYSTTTQMNSAIQQKANEITSSVSQTYTTKTEFDNLKIGARNYVLNSGLTKNSNNFSFSSGVSRDTNKKTPNGNNSIYINISGLTADNWRASNQAIGNKLEIGKTYTIGANVFVPSSHGIDRGASLEIICWNSSGVRTGTFYAGINTSIVDKWQSLSQTFTVPANTIRYTLQVYVVRNGKLYAGDYSLVEGDKSIWSPAPEDIQANIDAVDGKFANYSTTTQMNSAINQKANEITSSVSSTYTTKSEFNTLNIGSTNLVAGTKDFSSGWAYHTYYMTKTNETAIDSRFTGMSISFTPSTAGDDYADLGKTKCVWLEPDTEYTLSFWAKGTGKFYTYLWGTSVGPVASHYNSSGYSGTQNDGSSIHILSSNDTFKRYWVVYKTKSTTQGSYNLVATRVAKNLKTDVSMIIYGVKFEKGNKPTDWSPAPEDVQANIDAVDGKFANYSTTTQMNSAIQQKANEITSSVSSTYTTKTEFNNLEVGGRNYLTEVKRLGIKILKDGTGSTPTLSISHAECPHGYYLIGAQNGDSAYRIPNVISSNGIWTVSFELRGSQNAKVGFWMDICDLGAARFVTTVDNQWVKHSLTVNVTNYSADLFDFIDLYSISWAHVYIRNIKVEKGSKATDWSPAPEDVQANIDAVDGKFANYSTTTQMNSAINQKANEITSSVSSTYTTKTEFNNLKVGGRNLIRHSNVVNRNATSASYDKNTATWTLTANAGTGDNWGVGLALVGDSVRIPYGKTYVLSFEIKVPRACSWNIDVNNYAVTGSSWGGNDNDSARATSSKSLVANQWIKCWSRITNTSSGNTNKVDIYDNSNFGVVMLNETSSMTYQIRNIQGEIGNIPSEYTPAPEDVQSQIDTINTNIATSYATKSELTQTNNSIVAKFSESGGYNLIRNSTGAGGNTNGWTHTATSMGVDANDGIGSANRYYLYLDNGTTTTERYAYSSRFKLKPNTTYRFTGYFHNYTKCPSFDVFVLSSTSLPDTDTTTGYTNAHHLIQGASTNDSWKKFTTTFTTPASTKSGILRIDNNGYNQSGTNSNRVHWNCLILTEGEMEVPWSPHPSEIYDGITKIDKNGLQVSQSNYNGYTQMKADGFYVNNGSENVISITKDGSYFKGKVVITSGSTVPTSVLSGTISSSQLNSSITSDISTAKSNASTAVSTANTASTNASNAVKTANTASTNASNAVKTANTASTNASNAVSTANTASTNASNAVKTANTASTNASTAVSTANTAKSTADTAKSTADSVKSTVDSGKTNWNNAYNRVNEWAYGAVTGSTTIDGGYIQADTITAKHMAIGDFNNYSQLVKGKSLTNRYGTATWTEGTSNHSYWVTTNQYFPFTVNETLNPFKASDRVQIKFDAYTPSTRNVQVGIWFYSKTNADGHIGDTTAYVSCSATWGTKTVNLTLPSGNTYVQSAKSIAILINNGTSGERIEVRNVTIRRLVAGDLIVDGAITAAKIASRTITADRIVSGAITANEIKSRTITADRIVSGAITANEIAAGTITAAKIASGAITADKLAANAITSKTITGSTITGGTISGATITSETLMKTYGGMYVGSEIWGGFKKGSNGNYSSTQTFTIRGSAALQIDGNPTRISSVTGEVKIGDASSYDNLRAREIYAQEIIYTNDLRTRDAAQLSLSNVSMRSANAFIEFSSGYGVIRVKDRNHLYLQTKGNTGGDTSAEIRCTRYSDTSNYVNIRAYNVCAQNAVYANGVNVSSDINRKRDIELYSTDALHEVCSTPVYAYHLDTDKDEELKRIGIIMQEAPLDAIDLTGKGVDLYQMVTMLWRAVQQQQEIINELKGE